ncbi:MAG: PBP1A family penicillin-binding protein [Blastocatellia bacterium]
MRRRTVIYSDTDQQDLSLREKFVNLLDHISAHTPAPVRRIASKIFRPRVLLITGAILLVMLVVGVYYYKELAREIDLRLAGATFDNSVSIFSSPFKVSTGDRLPVDELTGYLHAAGYQQTAESSDSVSTYSISGDSVRIIPSIEATTRFRLNPVSIRLNKEGRILSLTSAQTGERLNSAFIEGELLASVHEGDRSKKIAVQFSEIPDNLKKAILAVEDRRFFSHSGIDWRGIGRALKADLGQGEVVQGGSTITQQLIKNAFLSSDRTFSRKLKEAAMAVILESRLSKEQIFALYCNEIYLGQSGVFAVHGFGQAAQVYFDKDIEALTMSESAFLAGLIHAPNRYTSHNDTARAVERRNRVLDGMVEINAVTPSESEAAKQEPLQLKKHLVHDEYGTTYFLDYAQRFMEERGLSSRQQITTTMDPRLQRAAYEAVKRNSERLDKVFTRARKKGETPEKVQAAIVAIDAHTGEILAMVGGRSYDESQLNRATDSMRQPGSTFKPFVYAAALGSRSYTPASLLSDTPQTFTFDGGRSEYKPTNYHGGFSNRDVTLREALARSLNVPTVELAMRIGMGNIAKLAEECGLDKLRPYPSMALGASEVTPLALAGAYTSFANDGMALRPVPVKSALSASQIGSDKVSATGVRVFSPQVAYLMTNLMQSVVDSGTASKLRAMGLKGAMAGKTGTSNDGWFVGYTPNIVCVAWVGFDDNRDLQMKASDAALPMWADFMKQTLDLRPGLGGDSFTKPGGLVTVDIDPATGYVAGPDCSEHRQEIFLSGTEPFAQCSHQSLAEADPSASPYEQFSSETQEDMSGGQTTLDICAESGLVASSQCRRVIKKSFESGFEPREFCRGEHNQTRPAEPPILEPVARPEDEKRNREDKPSRPGITSSSLRVPNANR